MLKLFNHNNSIEIFISYMIDLIIPILMIYIDNKYLSILLIFISYAFKLLL